VSDNIAEYVGHDAYTCSADIPLLNVVNKLGAVVVDGVHGFWNTLLMASESAFHVANHDDSDQLLLEKAHPHSANELPEEYFVVRQACDASEADKLRHAVVDMPSALVGWQVLLELIAGVLRPSCLLLFFLPFRFACHKLASWWSPRVWIRTPQWLTEDITTKSASCRRRMV
jgi:hypothetical protein